VRAPLSEGSEKLSGSDLSMSLSSENAGEGGGFNLIDFDRVPPKRVSHAAAHGSQQQRAHETSSQMESEETNNGSMGEQDEEQRFLPHHAKHIHQPA